MHPKALNRRSGSFEGTTILKSKISGIIGALYAILGRIAKMKFLVK